ncbi:MAG: hypothetical protein GC154_15005 [bacterium]|nr:hypothetical protein [bacterium]
MKRLSISSALFFFLILSILTVGFYPAEVHAGSVFPLDGAWRFSTDAEDAGVEQGWFQRSFDVSEWRSVSVPHTWQVEPGLESYYGIAWYVGDIPPLQPDDPVVLLEFDAVYRDSSVWVNGEKAGEHNGSGWTPFRFDVSPYWKPGEVNRVAVRVDNRFSANALPYERSSDWAADGGLIRSVRLRFMPPVYIDALFVSADPSDDFSSAEVKLHVRLAGELSHSLQLHAAAVSPDRIRVAEGILAPDPSEPGRAGATLTISRPDLWHFDHPALYELQVQLMENGVTIHSAETRFGVRSIECREGFYYLNGEPMRLMGVEWMPGSDPRYGMAESPDAMREVMRGMKRLNCVITRFHWQQDDSVFDFMDREGMLTQEEVPAWGGKTMQGDLDEIQALHTREMIEPHYNHPSIYAWGLCNEIQGQRDEAWRFVQRGAQLARELDPTRLLTWASNSLQSTPEKDASRFSDFIEWNEYYESWYGGTVADASAALSRIAAAFPGKSIVVSEYGVCECSDKNPTGDDVRIRVLKTHTDAYRGNPSVAGAIFFDYNDYRTHVGDKGQGAFQQRVHGVVDLLGKPKPSWEALRREASPIRSLTVAAPRADGDVTRAAIEIETRSLENDFPAYTLRGYELIWIAYDKRGLPMGSGKITLPDLAPGSLFEHLGEWPSFDGLDRVTAEVFRPTGYSVLDAQWDSD